MKVVLVIGDRPDHASALAERLGILGVEAVPCARDLKLAVRSLMSNDVSAILLDVDDSPESESFFDTIRGVTDQPIIARGLTKDTDCVISYLESGATDFISRTTSSPLLAAKISSFLRSLAPGALSNRTVRVGDVEVDLSNRVVRKGTEEVALSRLEFKLLSVLTENKGRPCSHEELLETVWGEQFTNCSHYLRLYIGYLRHKLETDPRRPRILLTEWGYGYRLVEPKAGRQRARSRTALRLASG